MLTRLTDVSMAAGLDFVKSPQLAAATDVAQGSISDEQRLAQLGHQQELRRSFSLPALVALCICLMATWEATSSVIATALTSGGPPCLIYNLQVPRRPRLELGLTRGRRQHPVDAVHRLHCLLPGRDCINLPNRWR